MMKKELKQKIKKWNKGVKELHDKDSFKLFSAAFPTTSIKSELKQLVNEFVEETKETWLMQVSPGVFEGRPTFQDFINWLNEE